MSTKVAPWLQGLSDGWEAPKEHSAQAQVSSASHDADSIRRSASRIPRRGLNGRPTSIRSHTTTSQQSVQRYRNPLAPVTTNDVNSMRHQNDTIQKPGSRSFSGAPDNVSTPAGTVQQRSKSSSPAKKAETMEWKRRLLNKQVGYGDQTDLFGPSGLENIFAKGRQGENDRPRSKDQASWLQQGSDVPMPSSPPPWPSDAPIQPAEADAGENLASMREENSLLDRDNSLRSNPFDLECSRLTNTQQSGPTEKITRPNKSPSTSFLQPPSHAGDRSRTLSGQTELEHEEFSPVFIAKNTSVDGKVGYAALDARAIQEMDAAKKTSQNESRQSSRDAEVGSVPSGHEENTKPRQEKLDRGAQEHNLSFSENLLTGSPVPNLGQNVEFHRGGYSRYGSFKDRLLSSSESQRIHDESEIAQSHFGEEDLPRYEEPQTPELVTQSPKRSSGSPLKLFGDHDTFTNNRLLRRLSQLNPDGTLAARSKAPSRNSTRAEHGAHMPAESQQASRQSSFGTGELNEHSFNADITITSPSNSDKDASEGSPASDVPVPGSKIPSAFKFDQSLGDNELGSLKRRSSRQTPADTSEVSHYGVQLAHFPQSAVMDEPAETLIDAQDANSRNFTGGKRPHASPLKIPTPKRRRTLHASEMEGEMNGTNQSFSERLKASGNSRKRKDARPGVAQNTAEPDVLASRRILRPRNPTPTQVQKQDINAELREAAEDFAAQQSDRLEAVLEQIESSMTSDSRSSLQEQAEALATEVAAFTLNVRKPSGSVGERKRSVTTQDFLNEAMMVMKLIRAKARPQSNLGSVEESGGETVDPVSQHPQSENSESLLRVSRPPSREGSGWRPRSLGQHTDARVVSHLRKFQENEDKDNTDFIANTLASLQHDEDPATNENVVVVDENANIRITGPRVDVEKQRDAEESRPVSQRSDGTNLGTQTSAGTSTAHTAATNSTRKSENVGTLAPDAVAHLIGEQVGGMTFDREKQRWIRQAKNTEMKRGNFLDLPSTATSDDDPFREISDLPVDEQVELRRISSPAKFTHAQAAALPSEWIRKSSVHDHADQNTNGEGRMASNETVMTRPATSDGNPQAHHLNSSSAPSRYSVFASSQQEKVETRATSWSDQELARMSATSSTKRPLSGSTVANALLMHYGGPSIATVPEEGDSSLTQTADRINDSPLASVTSGSGDVKEPRETGLRDDTALDAEEQDAERIESPKLRRTPNKPMSTINYVNSTAGRQISLRQQTLRNRFMADAHEQSELSVIAPLSGDRLISLSLSVTRPVASRPKARDITAFRSSPHRGDSNFILSDLPDFTINEEDEVRPSEKALALRLANYAAAEANDRYSIAVKEMVKTLADLKEDELYWEDVKSLNLRDRSLESVYGLEEFCSRIEQLDVSTNALTHLQGAPLAIRTLFASSNLLTSLTPWSHLTNLQYLDISNNRLDNLDGLSCLVHLRELCANDNQIDDMSGILDMDGLLKLRLKRNKLRYVDFETSSLHRLEELDLSENQLASLDHVGQIASLKTLRLDGNNFQDGLQTSQAMLSLSFLSMSRCQMRNLVVTALPKLTHLNVDDNCLAEIGGLENLKSLETLSLRRQRLPAGRTLSVFNRPFEARTVRLSGNDVRTLNLSHSFLNIQSLEIASAGLEELPRDFGLQLPNLRSLNLNFNGLKDVRPLLNIQKLQYLSICGNRLERLRKSIAVFSKLKHLESLDLRDNPITQRFHAPLLASKPLQQIGTVSKRLHGGRDNTNEDEEAEKLEEARHVLSRPCADQDSQHLSRLDEETKLRRRVFELLLANSCESLTNLDGLEFDRKGPMVKDDTWARLFELGVIRKTSQEADV